MKTNWKIDNAHSELRFEIDYLMISKISGWLTKFDASFQTDENGLKNIQMVQFSAESNSINTNSNERDEHLKSEDFFDAIQYPNISFAGAEFLQGAATKPVNPISSYRNDFKLSGNLTIKNITREVTLDGIYGGSATDQLGRKKAGFSFKLKLKRKDFGLTLDSITPAGKLIIGGDVTITGNCQFIKEA